MQIVFLIGSVEHAIPGDEAHRLEGVIREKCADLHGRAHDDNARACLQLADVIREYLQRGQSAEPIELGITHVEGLCEYVIEEETIASVELLRDLCSALRRYRDDDLGGGGDHRASQPTDASRALREPDIR